MKYLLARKALRWTKSHYSKKAFEMINTKSAREFLNQVSPEIREHWEEKKNVSLAEIIARIEEIEASTNKDMAMIKNIPFIFAAVICILLFSVALLWRPVLSIVTVSTYTLAVFVTAFISLSYIICIYNRRIDAKNEQERLSSVFVSFNVTILSLCQPDILTKNKPIDDRYLTDSILKNIKDVLLKEAMYRSQRYNNCFSLETVSLSLAILDNSRATLEKNLGIVTDWFGVKINRRSMFKKAAEEMRQTHPGLKEYFVTEEEDQ